MPSCAWLPLNTWSTLLSVTWRVPQRARSVRLGNAAVDGHLAWGTRTPLAEVFRMKRMNERFVLIYKLGICIVTLLDADEVKQCLPEWCAGIVFVRRHLIPGIILFISRETRPRE